MHSMEPEEEFQISKIVLPPNETEFGGRPTNGEPLDFEARRRPKDLPEEVYFKGIESHVASIQLFV